MRSVSASVRTSRGRWARTSIVSAPARSSDPASSSSAARRPCVAPRPTMRTSREDITWHCPLPLTGTLVNVGAILLGTLVGVLVGGRLHTELQTRVLHGLGLVVLVIGID